MTEPAFELIQSQNPGKNSLLFVCDHAASRLPPAYGTLGLDEKLLATHIAYDIGAADVTRALAAGFHAPAVLARWSRLLVDLNRGADDPTLIMQLSDGSIIPGNRTADVARRIAEFHAPYHAAIEAEIAAMAGVPVLVSIHSFTPVWKGRQRPWQFGILWDRDDRLAAPLIARLRQAGFAVGDNEPYTGELENDCLNRHGTMKGLPHVLIEIRQDLITGATAARSLADRLTPVLQAALDDMGPPAVKFTRPLRTGEMTMDETTREKLEAAVFRHLVAHLRRRTDVQNIDLMIAGGFCRNCLGDWYAEAAAEQGIALDKDEARALIYGMSQAEWKKQYQKEATPEQKAAFAASQKTHS